MANSSIDSDTEIFPNCGVIYPKVEIGKNCRIHANTTIGSDAVLVTPFLRELIISYGTLEEWLYPTMLKLGPIV